MILPTVAVLVGSLKRVSLNRLLAAEIARLSGDRLTFLPLDVAALPMFNEDLEEPRPASVAAFKQSIEKADAVLVVTPEHNRSIPAVTKNAVDWGSRPFSQNSWSGKPAALIGISPSRTGTAVAQSQLRSVLVNLGTHLMTSPEAYLVHHDGLFDAAGKLTDPRTEQFLSDYVDSLVGWIGRFT